MVAPTMVAILLLLLRPLVVLEGVGGGDDCVGGRVMTLDEDEVGAMAGVEAAEEKGMWIVVVLDVPTADVLIADVPIADVVGLAVAGFDVALDAAFSPSSCEVVHKTEFCPFCSTILKSLLIIVGGVALEVLRSDTWKWHTQAFPSSRGTRAEPVVETDWLYAGQ